MNTLIVRERYLLNTFKDMAKVLKRAFWRFYLIGRDSAPFCCFIDKLFLLSNRVLVIALLKKIKILFLSLNHSKRVQL